MKWLFLSLSFNTHHFIVKFELIWNTDFVIILSFASRTRYPAVDCWTWYLSMLKCAAVSKVMTQLMRWGGSPVVCCEVERLDDWPRAYSLPGGNGWVSLFPGCPFALFGHWWRNRRSRDEQRCLGNFTLLVTTHSKAVSVKTRIGLELSLKVS